MFASKFKTVLLAAILATSAAAAQADVITFEGIAPTNTYVGYSTLNYLSLPGYNLTPSVSAYVIDSAYYAKIPEYAENGTDYLWLTPGYSATLTSTASPLFSVNSIDLANYIFLKRQCRL